jgi:hypothetical protein
MLDACAGYSKSLLLFDRDCCQIGLEMPMAVADHFPLHKSSTNFALAEVSFLSGIDKQRFL